VTSTTRRLAALPVLGVALVLAAFGVVRGASDSGPAHGVRLVVAIAPPVDTEARDMAAHVARERVEEKGAATRVVPAGKQLVVEIGADDPQRVAEFVQLLERTPAVGLYRADANGSASDAHASLDATHVRHVDVLSGGVAIEVDDAHALAGITRGERLAVVIDGRTETVVVADRVVDTELHLVTSGADEDAALRVAMSVVAVLEAGAVHPLHVTHQETFTRAFGFWPRAWPFLLAGAVLALVAAGMLLISRRALP
jgi:hypothetical protein